MAWNGVVNGVVLVGVALTHLHPGAGRAPGVVDLPVVRDNLGYPMVFAQSVKGALKSLCGRRKRAVSDGRLDCGGEGRICCCLFGGEPGEGEKGAGALTVLDLVPLAFPVASADKGYLYVTSHSLVSRATALLRALGSGLADFFSRLFEESVHAKVLGLGDVGDSVYVVTTPVRVERRASDELQKSLEVLKGLREVLSSIHPLAGTMFNRLLVLEDSLAVSVIDKALLRITRVRLDRATKTVARGALWTEEYIPQGTVFLTGLASSGYLNSFCTGDEPICTDAKSCLEKVKESLALDKGFSVFIGGKETVGKGLMVFKAVPEG